MHVLLVEAAVKDLKVSTTTVDVLFVLHGELDDQRLVLVWEGREFVGESVEAGILGSLKTCRVKNQLVKAVLEDFLSTPQSIEQSLTCHSIGVANDT